VRRQLEWRSQVFSTTPRRPRSASTVVRDFALRQSRYRFHFPLLSFLHDLMVHTPLREYAQNTPVRAILPRLAIIEERKTNSDGVKPHSEADNF
jgi:hypothetical protein